MSDKITIQLTRREASLIVGLIEEHLVFLEDEGDHVNDLAPELRKQYEEIKHISGYIAETASL